jgi:hypothetical protein
MKRTVLAVSVVSIAIVAAIVVLNRKPSASSSGPLAGQPSSGLGQPLKVGKAFSVATVALGNEGKVAARVERVRVLGVTGPLELLGVRVRHLPGEPGSAFLGLFGFPPPEFPAVPLRQDPVVPVATERTESGDPLQELQLLIGVRATAPGIARYRAVEVTYSVSGRRYRHVYESAAYLCATTAPEINPADPCPTKETEGKFDDRTVDVTDILKA